MPSCCQSRSEMPLPIWTGRLREVSAWVFTAIFFVLTPKCPACLAAYISLGTGLGLSFSFASYLRCGILSLCAVLFTYLFARRLHRICSEFRHTKST